MVYVRIFFGLCVFLLVLATALLGVLNHLGYVGNAKLGKVADQNIVTDTYWITGEHASLMYQKNDASPVESFGVLSEIQGVPQILSNDSTYVLLGRPSSSSLFFGVKKDLFESRVTQLFVVTVPSLVVSTSSIPSLLGTFDSGRFGFGDIDKGADKGDVVFYDLASQMPIKQVHVDLNKNESFDPGCSPGEPTIELNEDRKTVRIRVYQNDDFITCRPLLSEVDVPL